MLGLIPYMHWAVAQTAVKEADIVILGVPSDTEPASIGKGRGFLLMKWSEEMVHMQKWIYTLIIDVFSDTEDKYKMDPSWIKEGAVVINVVGGPSWRKCQVEDEIKISRQNPGFENSKQHICRESLNLPLGSTSPDLWSC